MEKKLVVVVEEGLQVFCAVNAAKNSWKSLLLKKTGKLTKQK